MMFVRPSSEFIALCQAQVYVLVQGLGATWCAVYLTEKWVEGVNPNLVPVVVYPDASIVRYAEEQPDKSGKGWQKSNPPFPRYLPESQRSLKGREDKIADRTLEKEFIAREGKIKDLWGKRQAMLPLLYEEEVLGVLVTRRDDREWEKRELAQVENIVRTLAIARYLDRQQGWTKEQLLQQQLSIAAQRDRFDDLLHQLRNPMTALRTFGKLLLKRLLPGDKNSEIAENLIRESDRLQTLLKQFDVYLDEMSQDAATLIDSPPQKLLPESKSSSKSSPLSLLPEARLRLQTFPISEVLNPLLQSAAAIAGDRGLEFRMDIPDDLLPIQADANALREVLNNVLDNAIKYTPRGGYIAVEAGLDHENGLLQGVAIRDTGYGIPEGDRDRIFDRHYRGIQEEGEIEGTGLGLAIVKGLIEQMNGKIEVSDNLQGDRLLGTAFMIWLPLA
ncbi:ATP-binding protein [Spirulina sp. 06S082]|uniref:GAF domain-containing sensor histidine kinase n=1 Tax=Spirulina sp. 06S082 TaxID=3110248 RepID=UPI002B21D09F|nr:ATP-binding protein [Spirulina sp. 06S082]MEA5471035.1 ATP-binding protein [Spirulina sp. 06S082]